MLLDYTGLETIDVNILVLIDAMMQPHTLTQMYQAPWCSEELPSIEKFIFEDP